MMETSATKHQHITRERLRSLPKTPGVYMMKGEDGQVIYIGKAKHIKNRVRSYFAGGDGRYNVPYLVLKVRTIETIVTADERQAIVLEADLIKKFKPRYNIRLKDDKAHYLVRIDLNHSWPHLELVRKVEADGARYFGPYAFGYELRLMLEVIKRSIPLRTCTDRVMLNRVRPCLEYQIKRCAGPCCLPVDATEYQQWVKQAIAILEGKNTAVIAELEAAMNKRSEEHRFEEAAEIRDRLLVLKKIRAEKPSLQIIPGRRDAIGLFRDGSDLEFTVLRARHGRIFETKTFGFTDIELPSEEVMSSFLSQLYAVAEEIPDEILLAQKLEDSEVREDLFSDRAGHSVKILNPQRGARAQFLSVAEQNAEENFRARASQTTLHDELLKKLQGELSLDEVPRTIECVDISHLQGGSTVGSVVSFQDGLPNKNRYRRFHLSQEGKPDDFASMREVMLRHLSRGAEENSLPDLIIIDGGIGQLNAALGSRKELGLQQPVLVALAKKKQERVRYHRVPSMSHLVERKKKPERVYLENASIPVILQPESEVLHLLERIRNEAHRFVITFHRDTRSRRVFRSALDDVPGVGPLRRKKLLRAFASIQAIKEATPEEIEKRCGFPLSLAKRIQDLLRRKEKGGAE